VKDKHSTNLSDAAHTMRTPYAHHHTHALHTCTVYMWTCAHYYYYYTHMRARKTKNMVAVYITQLLLLCEPALGCLCTAKLRHRGLVQANCRTSKDYSGLAERSRNLKFHNDPSLVICDTCRCCNILIL